MKYVEINNNTMLPQLSQIVGSRNLDSVLHINGLKRTPDIGRQFTSMSGNIIVNSEDVPWQRKSTILNKLVGDSDLFELACLQGESAWKLLSARDTFTNMLKIPDSVNIPDSSITWGNNIGVPTVVYRKALDQLASELTNHKISPDIFNEYSVVKPSQIPGNQVNGEDVYQWFRIPWGDITLYSSISDETIDFPVYPEEISDSVKANYTQMPELIYQYEPWQLYQSSGPRQNTYSFEFHRDMWTGDHRDGYANKLVRFCQSNCYPEYNGSAVNVPQVTLYLMGKTLISGVMTDVNVNWSGPIGLDGFYLMCKLEITIVEVSKQALNYQVVKEKSLIG